MKKLLKIAVVALSLLIAGVATSNAQETAKPPKKLIADFTSIDFKLATAKSNYYANLWDLRMSQAAADSILRSELWPIAEGVANIYVQTMKDYYQYFWPEGKKKKIKTVFSSQQSESIIGPMLKIFETDPKDKTAKKIRGEIMDGSRAVPSLIEMMVSAIKNAK